MKKLQLNKEVIAQLGNREMILVEGGTNNTRDANCPPTMAEHVCPGTYFCTGNEGQIRTTPYDPEATGCDQDCYEECCYTIRSMCA